jgi:hypothetical protein
MARMASTNIMCVDSKAVKEKFTSTIRWCLSDFAKHAIIQIKFF